MGIAAYNRGSVALSREIDANQRPVEFEMMEYLNNQPKYADAGKPFMPIQFVWDSRGFWIALCPKTGYGLFYDTLIEAVRRWKVTIVGFDNGTWLTEVQP